jgi:alkylation response protein AidB-like acyl-CoA dehydrogenase
MRFSFTEDQTMFAAALRDMLTKECPAAHVRGVWDSGTGHSPALWSKLGEMGVLGLLADAPMVDAILLFQELGRAAVPGPVVEHAAVVVPALAAEPEFAGLLDGTLVATAAGFDGSPHVAHGAVSDLVLTPHGVLRGATWTDLDGIDRGRRLYRASGGSQSPLPAGFDASGAYDRGAVAMAAYLIGLGERMIEIAAEYARQREQFGKPIGAFQAVKHLLSDALLQVEFAKPVTYAAAWSMLPHEVSMAKALAGEAAYRASRSSMQVHGGIGYTWESDLQLWMKKAWALMRAWGDAPTHRRRVSAHVLA